MPAPLFQIRHAAMGLAFDPFHAWIWLFSSTPGRADEIPTNDVVKRVDEGLKRLETNDQPDT